VSAQQQKSQPPQYRQTPAPATVIKVSNHVYEVRGGAGANCSFIIGDKGTIVIDAKMDCQSAKDMINAIKKTTDKPITHLILTHSDRDHVNGMTCFPENIDIIAHNNSARHIRKANENIEDKLPLPGMTFHERIDLYSGNLEIDLIYFGHAHTDGDIVVFVPQDKIAIIGDLFFKGRDPLIHMHKNGYSLGLTRVLKKVIDLDAVAYLSGHAEPAAKSEIESLRKTIVDKQDKIKAMVKEGKSLNEVKRAFGISPEKSRWPSLAEVIFLEVAYTWGPIWN